MMVLLILAICAVFVLINKAVYKKVINFPSVITVIWCVTLALSTLGLYDTFIPSDTVVAYALSFVFGINLFSAVFYKLMPRKGDEKKKKIDISISNSVLTIVLAICTVLLLVVSWEGFALLIETGDFSKVRNAYINYETIGTHLQVLVSITLIPIGRAASTLVAIDFVYNKKIKSSFVMAVVFLALSIFTTGGRGALFFVVLAFIIALYDKEGSVKNAIAKNKIIFSIIGLSVVFLLFITFQRGFADNSIMQSIYVYFAGCFNLFGVYLDGAVVFSPLLYGQALVSGITFPFIEVMRFFGADILPGNYILAEQATAKYIPISPTVAINATPTTMFPAVRDFGEAGLMIYPAVICLAFQWLKNKCDEKNDILRKALFINFVSSALLLNMAFQFGTFQAISVFLYIFIICKASDFYIKRRRKRSHRIE